MQWLLANKAVSIIMWVLIVNAVVSICTLVFTVYGAIKN